MIGSCAALIVLGLVVIAWLEGGRGGRVDSAEVYRRLRRPH